MTALELSLPRPVLFSPTSHRPRLLDVDRGKGLAIILVVIGHIAARETPAGNGWYEMTRYLINSFHMPFFMYLAGLTFFYTGHARNPAPQYLDFVLNRARRLLVPFFALGVAIVVGKSVARSFLYVDNMPIDAGTALQDLVWDTGASPAESIWFLFVLFVYSAVVPVLLWLSGKRLLPILAVGLTGYLVSEWFLLVPSRLYADRVATYLIFFLIGGIAHDRGWFLATSNLAFAIALAAFGVALAMLASGLFRHEAFVLCNFLGIPALHGIVRRTSSDILLWLGKYAFVIYLFNSIFIGMAKGSLLRFMSWDGAHFIVFFASLGLAGLLGPVLVKRYVFNQVPVLDRLTN